MSNTTVGNVYAQIIADVIDASRVDFEENGVDESVLEELKKVSTIRASQQRPRVSSVLRAAFLPSFHQAAAGILVIAGL
jgi:transcription initiation factor TFIIA large subunit